MEQVRPPIISIPITEIKDVVFKIIDIPEKKPKTFALLGQILALNYHGKWVKKHMKIKIFMPINDHIPKMGEVYVSRLRIKDFNRPVFPHEKDWRSYFHQKGIMGTSFLSRNAYVRLSSTYYFFDYKRIFRQWQSQLNLFLMSHVKSGINLDVAQAMLLGVKSTIDFETNNVYSSLGAIHILSVSGLHVGLLYLGLQFIFGFLLKRGDLGKGLFFILMMTFMWIYAGISGFSDPVLRSAWMFSVMLFAKSFHQQQNGINTLSFSCFTLLCYDPYAVFQAGFQLSYLAVLGLIIFQSKILHLYNPNFTNVRVNWVIKNSWELTCVAISAQILTWPLVIYYFHQFPNPFWFFLLNPFLILFSSIALGLGFVFLISAPLFQWLNLDAWIHFVGIMLDYSFTLLHAPMYYFVNRFHPIIPFIRFEFLDLVFYFGGIIGIYFWNKWRHPLFIWGNVMLLGLSVIYYLADHSSDQGIAFLSQYKGEPIFVYLKHRRAVFVGPKELKNDPAWVQSHLSPLWAYYGIKDTLGQFFPTSDYYRWKFKDKEFIFMNKPILPAKGDRYATVIMGNKIKFKHLEWIKKWKDSPIFFVKKPSNYWQNKIKIIRMEKEIFTLDERPAVEY